MESDLRHFLSVRSGQKLKVAVIGAGAAGLCSAAVFDESGVADVTIFEKSGRVGGVWNHEKAGDHSTPMYRSLRTNIPKEIMQFPDEFHFEDTTPSFAPHAAVLKYLQTFCEKKQLGQKIRFNTPAQSVRRVKAKAGSGGKAEGGWVINGDTENIYDVVVVASGHYNEPYCPDLGPGKFRFTGPVMHSKDYDKPDVFKGERVLVVGARASGTDLAWEISRAAEKVVWSHPSFGPQGKERPSGLPENVHQAGNLVEVDEEGNATFVYTAPDGTENREVVHQVDRVIWATGYYFFYPFFDAEQEKEQAEGRGVEGEDRVIPHKSRWEGKETGGSIFESLTGHLWHAQHPDSLFFIGLPFNIIPFPMFFAQATAALRSSVMRPEVLRQLLEVFPEFPPQMSLEQFLYDQCLLEFASGDANRFCSLVEDVRAAGGPSAAAAKLKERAEGTAGGPQGQRRGGAAWLSRAVRREDPVQQSAAVSSPPSPGSASEPLAASGAAAAAANLAGADGETDSTVLSRSPPSSPEPFSASPTAAAVSAPAPLSAEVVGGGEAGSSLRLLPNLLVMQRVYNDSHDLRSGKPGTYRSSNYKVQWPERWPRPNRVLDRMQQAHGGGGKQTQEQGKAGEEGRGGDGRVIAATGGGAGAATAIAR
uniref:Flavin-containing monooxygenase n=1 Tax=Chromera velia CCMP2878 TaxID=1169474 RepID=A0A0G4FQ04_9ALVE|eukprot:Cvel_18082.t1-p1 / transcript=Cvel_18082.t1 / gene=Cvel_18082 / organism=Chromera_velia_CCMP2878 / gene_product=Flavin-containing monooxygenase FMO GS-OX-like 2, putative / transcript_product=Flavin-containing monooxygenase FMO GS-OX-like 2, putative / location=Cvel_scaffold1480:4138-7933(-) / protein_length=647 / sequence_SO=supercontig / SO=protein_coding / is_pseudo=false